MSLIGRSLHIGPSLTPKERDDSKASRDLGCNRPSFSLPTLFPAQIRRGVIQLLLINDLNEVLVKYTTVPVPEITLLTTRNRTVASRRPPGNPFDRTSHRPAAAPVDKPRSIGPPRDWLSSCPLLIMAKYFRYVII